MAQVNKIDSNSTGLAYAEEDSIGTLGVSPTWRRLNPNSYSDFGGEVSTVAPNPIRDDRQRRKGVSVDLDASGGFNHNLTFFNLLDIMQGVMFADIREKGTEVVTSVDVDTSNPDEYEVAATAGFLVGSLIKGFGFTNSANNALNAVTAVTTNVSVEVADGELVDETPPSGAYIKVVGHQFDADDLNVVVSGDLPQITRDGSFDFTTLGLVAGQWIYIGGDTAATQFSSSSGANNGWKRVRSVAADAITLDKSDTTMVAESLSGGETIQIFFGDVLKNEQAADIVRRTYHIERLLGAPDDASTDVQSEVLTGALANEFVMNIPSAELINVDMSFVAIDNVQYTAGNELQTSVVEPDAADEFNSTSDVARINLGSVSSTNENPTDLFAYVTELTLTVNNNISPNKAVGTFGAFDVTAGTFAVSASVTAYFSNVSAVQAVRNNSDITLDVILAKENQGIAFDAPLLGLGDGRLNVEIDQPITLPLTGDAANGDKVDSGLNHTLLITYFYYLPDAAM